MFAKTGVLLVLSIGAIAFAQPLASETNSVVADTTTKETSIWKDTPMDTVVQEFKAECLQQSDSAACIKVKVLNLLDDVLRKDSYKVNDGVSIVPNENQVKEKTSARSSETGFLDQLENYVKGHDLIVKTPAGFLQGATFKLSPRNLDDNEINMSVKLPSEDDNETFTERGRKSKLKKILVPILVFVLLKAMTLIPLAIGVLGLKAWNALQLSFISFLVSISLAIFQLCKKVAADSGSQIAAHIPFETSHYAAARNFVVDQQRNVAEINDPQSIAYRAYAQAQSS
ncbi:uncharacterized protein Osi19 [Planococcus citri]|uniref:uncharacterized protein Osi19 n=1 Tax=Planococcus citri TaxID=170843 RepID=UPI0031F8F6B2